MRTRAPERPREVLSPAERLFARRRLLGRLAALRPALIAALVVASVAGLGWLLFFSSVLAAEKVKVTGAHVLSDAEVRRAAAVPLGTPLARVDLDAVRARVEDLAAVESVDASRCWPHTVCVEVRERQAVAVADKEGALWGLDRNGILFRRFATRPQSLPLVKMAATASTDALAEAGEVVDSLPATLVRRVEYVEVGSVDEISLVIRSGARVVWGSADQSSNKARVLAVLLREQPSAVQYDVSVPGNPTVRLH